MLKARALKTFGIVCFNLKQSLIDSTEDVYVALHNHDVWTVTTLCYVVNRKVFNFPQNLRNAPLMVRAFLSRRANKPIRVGMVDRQLRKAD